MKGYATLFMRTELKAIVALLNSNGDSYQCLFGSADMQNLNADEALFPVVCFDLPKVKYIISKSGYIGEKYPIAILVAYKSELDWTGDQHETVIDKANKATRELITRLNNYKDSDGNNLIDSIEFVDADRVKCVFDVCCSGIFIQLIVKPYINESVCLT